MKNLARLILTLACATIVLVACKKPDNQVSGGTTYQVNDLWPDSENPEGIVFYIDPASSTDGGITGTSGWVMSLFQSPELAYCTHQYTNDYGTNSHTDGRPNRDAVVAYESAHSDYVGKFEMFDWCRDNYSEEWYIPSLQEMRLFFCRFVGFNAEQTEAYMTKARILDAGMSVTDWVATESHRLAYSQMLVDAGGDPIDHPQYWTSTKYDVDAPPLETLPWYVEFGGGWGSASTQNQWDGHFVRVMRRFGKESPTTKDVLSVSPMEVTFQPSGETKTLAVTITASSYQVGAPTSVSWVHIENKGADSFSVRVDEYTLENAKARLFMDRLMYINVASGNATPVSVLVRQSAPEAPLDLAGTWNWTGEIWSNYPKQFAAKSGTVTATYNDTLGCYVFTPMAENQGVSTNFGSQTATDGGIALRVDASNKVTFVTDDAVGIYYMISGLFPSYRGYLNFASFYDNETFANVVTSSPYSEYGLPAGTAVEIVVGGDGNTITFPAKGTYNGVEYIYCFGFGFREIVSFENPSISPTADVNMAGGVYRNLIFTRTE